MSSRPDEIPSWASGPAENIVAPTSGQRETGWTTGQAPGSGVQNWYQEKAYRWLDYLRDARIVQAANAFNTTVYVRDSGAVLNAGAYNPTLRQMCFVGASGTIFTNGNGGSGASLITTESSVSGQDINGVVWSSVNSLFAAAGGGGGTGRIQTSTGNGTWTSRSTAAVLHAAMAIGNISGVDHAIAVGSTGNIRHSTDMTSWAAATSAFGTDDLVDAAFGNGTFVVTGGKGGIQSSTNGTTYTSRVANSGTVSAFVDYHANWGFIVYDRNSGAIKQSADGITWTTIWTVTVVGTSTFLLTADAIAISHQTQDAGNPSITSIRLFYPSMDSLGDLSEIQLNNIVSTPLAVIGNQLWAQDIFQAKLYLGGVVNT